MTNWIICTGLIGTFIVLFAQFFILHSRLDALERRLFNGKTVHEMEQEKTNEKVS